MKNPYKLSTTKTVRMYIDKDLAKLIKKYSKIAQQDSDMKFGKDKFKVPSNYGSTVLVRLLK